MQQFDKTPEKQWLLWFLREVDLPGAPKFEDPGQVTWSAPSTPTPDPFGLAPRVLVLLLLLFSALACLWIVMAGLVRLAMNPLQSLGLEGNLSELLPGMLACLIPAIIAALAATGIWWIAKQERNIHQKHQGIWDQFQEKLLQAYFRRLRTLSETYQLPQSNPGGPVRKIARAQTIIILPELKGEQKKELLAFLYQAGLITTPSIIDLREADFSQAMLDHIDLSRANLAGVNLRQASLVQANLAQTDLSQSDLSQADLRFTTLGGSSLQQANLSQAKLHRADLRQANLSGANLSQANLWQADLIGANLNQTQVTQAQLDAAQSWQDSEPKS